MTLDICTLHIACSRRHQRVLPLLLRGSLTDASVYMSSASTFQPLRRVLTSHQSDDRDGSNVVIWDDMLQIPLSPSGTTGMAPVFASLGLPADSAHTLERREIDEAVLLAPPTIVTPGGVNGRVVDMLPNQTFGMHRTSSIDYNIILAGSVDLITPNDGGVTHTRVSAGDVVVQRGTLHAWEAGSDGARWFSVIVDANTVNVNGNPLPDIALG